MRPAVSRSKTVFLLLCVTALGAPATGLCAAEATDDLIAVSVFLRDVSGNGGEIVDHPTVGQEVYLHFEFDVISAGGLAGTITELELDGVSACTWDGGVVTGTLITWCDTAWTAELGSHLLRGIVDPNDEFEETDEDNNVVERGFVITTADQIFYDGFVSGDTTAWSESVP